MATLPKGATYISDPKKLSQYKEDQLLRIGGKIYVKPQTATAPQAPAQPTNPLDVNALLSKLNSQQTDYQSSVTARQGFADALKQRLSQLDTTTQGMQQEQRVQQESQYNIPNTLREQLISQGITDPFARQKLIDERLGAANSNIGALAQLLQNRGARNEDILKSAQGTYEANLQGKQYGIENLRQQLQLAQQAQQEKQALEAAKQEALAKQQQAEQEFQQKIYLQQLAASLKGSGSSGGTGGSRTRSSGSYSSELPQKNSSSGTPVKYTKGSEKQSNQSAELNKAIIHYSPRIIQSGPKTKADQMTKAQLVISLTRQFPTYTRETIEKRVNNMFPGNSTGSDSSGDNIF